MPVCSEINVNTELEHQLQNMCKWLIVKGHVLYAHVCDGTWGSLQVDFKSYSYRNTDCHT
jgi:hypothetical protein